MAMRRQVSHGICSTCLVVSFAAGCRAPTRTDVATSAPVIAPEPSAATAGPTPPASAEPTATALPPASDTGLHVTAASASAPVARRTYVVAAIGDSLTDLRSHGGGYLTILQERCPE